MAKRVQKTSEELQKGLKTILYLKMKLTLQKFDFWDSAIILYQRKRSQQINEIEIIIGFLLTKQNIYS